MRVSHFIHLVDQHIIKDYLIQAWCTYINNRVFKFYSTSLNRNLMLPWWTLCESHLLRLYFGQVEFEHIVVGCRLRWQIVLFYSFVAMPASGHQRLGGKLDDCTWARGWSKLQTNAKSQFATISVTFLVLRATANLSTTRFSDKTNNNMGNTVFAEWAKYRCMYLQQL